MAWIKLTQKAAYLMRENCYVDKADLKAHTGSSTILNVPLEWFRDGNAPRTMVIEQSLGEPSACLIPATSHGIDVSGHQETVNWDAVKKAEISFAFIKATEGRTFVDDKFARNWSELKRLGILRGAYHFFLPDRSPQEQADNFLKTVNPGSGDLLPVLDVESDRGMSADKILQGMAEWLDIVAKAIGHKPFIYTFPSFWSDSLGNPTDFNDYPLWIAHYTSAAKPIVPGGWSNYTIWQYTESGTVSGVNGPVDRNRFIGTPSELMQFVI